MAIRSGRFNSHDVSGGNKLTIVVATKEGGIYRVFNSGPNAFVVDDATNSFTLEKTHSIDIGVSKTSLNISTSVKKDVEGIYDILTSERVVRSGRFKVAAPSSMAVAPEHKVIALANINKLGEKFYRFFNSGDAGDPADDTTWASFKIKGLTKANGSTAQGVTLHPGFSVDVQVKKNETISVEGINKGIDIEGIYDYLG